MIVFVSAGCTKAFSQLSNLQSHSRCHQTDKPYKCNSCYKCFSDEQALFDHIPKHKESKHIKTHICSYCGKSYTQVNISNFFRPRCLILTCSLMLKHFWSFHQYLYISTSETSLHYWLVVPSTQCQ